MDIFNDNITCAPGGARDVTKDIHPFICYVRKFLMIKINYIFFIYLFYFYKKISYKYNVIIIFFF